MEIAGTPPYMAPEVHCRKAYGRAMDWWSLGVTLYKLMIGRVPFRGQNEVILKVRSGRPPRLHIDPREQL